MESDVKYSSKYNATLSTQAQETLRERLLRRKAEVEKAKSNIDTALAFLDSNPNMEEFHDLIMRVGF